MRSDIGTNTTTEPIGPQDLASSGALNGSSDRPFPHAPDGTQSRAHPHQALRLASKAGRIMLANGAEVYRVEENIQRICYATGYHYAECFALPTGIFVSLGYDAPDSEMSTIIKRVSESTIDLQKISEINEFTRDYCDKKLTITEAFARLQQVDNAPHFNLALRLFGAVVIAVAYTLINGGDWLGCVVALFAGVATYGISLLLEKIGINRFIVIITSVAVCTFVSMIGVHLGLGATLSAVIVGSVTIFLPGVAIANGTRDLLHGDILTGITRIAEGLLIAISMAFGVATVLHLLPNLVVPDVLQIHPLYLHLAFALVGTVGVGLVVNIPRRHLPITAVIGMLGWLIFRLCLELGQSRPLACFLAACFVVLVSTLIARHIGEISTAFIIPAIWLFVPGAGMYNAMLAVLESDSARAFSVGTEALMMAGSIGVAMVLILSLFKVFKAARTRLQK